MSLAAECLDVGVLSVSDISRERLLGWLTGSNNFSKAKTRKPCPIDLELRTEEEKATFASANDVYI